MDTVQNFGGKSMKRIIWIVWALAVVVFFADWIFIGLSLAHGNYEITPGIYVGLFCMVVILAYPFYKLFGSRCPHCGKVLTLGWKYCPYCGKEVHSKQI